MKTIEQKIHIIKNQIINNSLTPKHIEVNYNDMTVTFGRSSKKTKRVHECTSKEEIYKILVCNYKAQKEYNLKRSLKLK